MLRDICLNVKAGSTVALVGNSGGGKTTIVNLLPRFTTSKAAVCPLTEPTSATIRCNRCATKSPSFSRTTSVFGHHPRQHLLGKPGRRRRRSSKALEMAYLDDFVLRNHERVGLRHRRTRIGALRRTAAAAGNCRALVKDAPIVILDEATSALDNRSEAVVQKAIDNLMQDRTVFVIAHRLSTIQNADLIVVLNNGEIVETGTHDELMAKENGAYKNLYEAQFKSK